MLICKEVRLLLAHGEHAQTGCVLGLPLSFSVALPFLNGLSWGSSHSSGSRPAAWRLSYQGLAGWTDRSVFSLSLSLTPNTLCLLLGFLFRQVLELQLLKQSKWLTVDDVYCWLIVRQGSVSMVSD